MDIVHRVKLTICLNNRCSSSEAPHKITDAPSTPLALQTIFWDKLLGIRVGSFGSGKRVKNTTACFSYLNKTTIVACFS